MTRRQRILSFVLVAIAIYIFIISIFGFLYQYTSSICYSKNDSIVGNFWDCFYFSLVSFQTIGYGDIFPFLPIAKILIFIESIFQTIFISLFSGFLIYFFIKRPKDVFTTDNYFYKKSK
ncbi:ion channel [Flavobacterium sp. 1]|uniref:ion channel n=1 Tax=Flavobacterium sp. 1 TaxID=2035200 RepID=UPI000C24F349